MRRLHLLAVLTAALAIGISSVAARRGHDLDPESVDDDDHDDHDGDSDLDLDVDHDGNEYPISVDDDRHPLDDLHAGAPSREEQLEQRPSLVGMGADRIGRDPGRMGDLRTRPRPRQARR